MKHQKPHIRTSKKGRKFRAGRGRAVMKFLTYKKKPTKYLEWKRSHEVRKYPSVILEDTSWIRYLESKGVKVGKVSDGQVEVIWPSRKIKEDITNPFSYFWNTEMAKSHKPKSPEQIREYYQRWRYGGRKRQFSDKELFSLDQWAPDGKVLLKDNNLALVYSKYDHPKEPFNIVYRADNPDPTVENWVDRIDLTKDYKSAKKIFDRESKELAEMAKKRKRSALRFSGEGANDYWKGKARNRLKEYGVTDGKVEIGKWNYGSSTYPEAPITVKLPNKKKLRGSILQAGNSANIDFENEEDLL